MDASMATIIGTSALIGIAVLQQIGMNYRYGVKSAQESAISAFRAELEALRARVESLEFDKKRLQTQVRALVTLLRNKEHASDNEIVEALRAESKE